MAALPLHILLCSAEHEKVQMAAMLASVAAVSERPVQVLVSMGAVTVFAREPAGERYQGGPFSALMREKKAPDALHLFGQGRMLGDIRMLVCAMALDVLGWTIEDLVEGLFDDATGLTKFLVDAEEGQFIVV